MLLGKKFPMDVRALRFVVLELLPGQLDNISSHAGLVRWLDERCLHSVLSEHCIKSLIKPVLLMLLYVRAEKDYYTFMPETKS